MMIALAITAKGETPTTGGFQADGKIIFTAYDGAEQPKFKEEMKFRVSITTGGRWKVRTEPFQKAESGIDYFETYLDTNNLATRVTAFIPLPETIQNTKGNQANGNTSNRLGMIQSLPEGYLSRESGKSASEGKRLKNDKTAIVRNDQFPPVDSSHSAVLWFAFTKPQTGPTGKTNMLYQIWDDAHGQNNIFRQAQWSQFDEYPFLISKAVYRWFGLKQTPAGGEEVLPTANEADDHQIAARYEVNSRTNIDGQCIPTEFRLLRYVRSGKAAGQALSTTVAKVEKILYLSATETPSTATLSNAVVNDFRAARTGNQNPIAYLNLSNNVPSYNDLTNSRAYKRQRSAKKASSTATIRTVVIMMFLAPLFYYAIKTLNQKTKKK